MSDHLEEVPCDGMAVYAANNMAVTISDEEAQAESTDRDSQASEADRDQSVMDYVVDQSVMDQVADRSVMDQVVDQSVMDQVADQSVMDDDIAELLQIVNSHDDAEVLMDIVREWG